MVQKVPLNTLLDTMIMMLSDHYAWSFHKWLAVLEGNTTMSFKISDNKLLKKYNRIWKRVEKLLKIEFDSKPVHGDNDKYIKAKIKIYGVTVNTNFRDKKMPKVKAPCKSLSIILLDSVVKVKKKHPPTLLEECKYEPKIIKMENLIDDDFEKSSSDESDSETDNDSNDETESDDESNE